MNIPSRNKRVGLPTDANDFGKAVDTRADARDVRKVRNQIGLESHAEDLAGCGKTRRKKISAKSKRYYDRESAFWINVVRGQKHFFRNLLEDWLWRIRRENCDEAFET